jgi:hypothetical protein
LLHVLPLLTPLLQGTCRLRLTGGCSVTVAHLRCHRPTSCTAQLNVCSSLHLLLRVLPLLTAPLPGTWIT